MLRDAVNKSPWCTLRTGCTVVGRPSEDPPTVEYRDDKCGSHLIRGQWLVGADGKVGVVRKHFLETAAGIRQEEGRYRYNGTWVAANLKISLPTPESHPEWPLWELAYTPEQAYDLFWPKGWHFCSPPGKPTATGRFGPHGARLWRHEFRQETAYENKDLEQLLWEHLRPMITRDRGEDGTRFQSSIQFPVDCITVLRCEPFRFTHKVVNKWYDKRTILVGDAAHVFPPFAGQGIASGLRDAHQLGWRLALLVDKRQSSMEPMANANVLLESWVAERRYSVADAAFFSTIIGKLCNNQISLLVAMLLSIFAFLERKGLLPRAANPQSRQERNGFMAVPGGFFIKGNGGGVRIAQIPLFENRQGLAVLSDAILRESRSIFTLLVVQAPSEGEKPYRDAKEAVRLAEIRDDALSEHSIRVYCTETTIANASPPNESSLRTYSPSVGESVGESHNRTYTDRLGHATKFAIIRPDLFIFATARDAVELGESLASLKRQLEDRFT